MIEQDRTILTPEPSSDKDFVIAEMLKSTQKPIKDNEPSVFSEESLKLSSVIRFLVLCM